MNSLAFLAYTFTVASRRLLSGFHWTEGIPSYAAPLVRHPFTGRRLRHPHDSRTAGPPRCQYDHDLHACPKPRRAGRSQSGGSALRKGLKEAGASCFTESVMGNGKKEGRMRIRLTLPPEQHGARQLYAQDGERLVCVRYRYDEQRRKRFKTVELIVEEKAWAPAAPPGPEEQPVG